MKKIKHSKFKNTGMLFELLTRQITSEIISGKESPSTQILKKFFNKNTELFKEYGLYKTLSEEKLNSEVRSNMLIEAVLKARKKINKSKLKEEKYELIKRISETLNLDTFFQTKVQNYKLLASIYKIFEYSELDNPNEITRSRFTIIENMTGESKTQLVEEMSSISKEPKEIRVLSYKIMVEKFNEKYGNLSSEQKNVLREYIGNVSNTNNLKSFIQNEAKKIKSTLTEKVGGIKDKALKIKLTEVINLLDQYDAIKNVEENHISALMRYYELVKDL